MAAPQCSEKSSTEKLFDLIRGEGTTDTIQIYLQESVDIDIDARDSEGFTPLLLACSSQQISVAQLLIEFGANVNVKCAHKKWTALHYASDWGWSDVVRSLVQEVTNLNAVDSGGRTALYLACCSILPDQDDWMDIFRVNPIRYASVPGSLEVVKCLVEGGADMDRKSTMTGDTPLLSAAFFSKRDVVDFLLASGANGDEGKLLYRASEKSWLDMVHALVKRVPNLNKRYSHEGETALHVASRYGYLEIVKCLVEGGADINSRNKFGQTALHKASSKGHLEIVKWLVEATADVNSKRGKGESTLPHDASQNERIEVAVQSVVKRTCDLDARSRFGMTALADACLSREFEIAQYLLGAGASCKIDPDIRFPHTPLSMITSGNEPEFEFMKLFIENGAYLDIHDYKQLVRKSSLKVLKDVKLCCQNIMNQFNYNHLPELYKLPISGCLPRIEDMKIVSGTEMAQSIKKTVEFEIQTTGLCNVLEVRPMVLSHISVASLLKYFEKKKSEMCNVVKKQAAFEFDSKSSKVNDFFSL